MKRRMGVLLSLLSIVMLFLIPSLFDHSNPSTDGNDEGRMVLAQNKEPGGKKRGESDSHFIQVLKELKVKVDGWLKSLNDRIERHDVTRFEVRFLEILRSILEWVKEKVDSTLESYEEQIPEKRGGGPREIYPEASLFWRIG